MDLNIGAALWMAAKAEGQVTVIPATTASREQPQRQEAAKQSGSAAIAIPVAAPHAGSINTSQHNICNNAPPSKLASPHISGHKSVSVAHHQGKLGDPSALVHDACPSQEDGEQATSSSSACSSTFHAAAPSSRLAWSGGAEAASIPQTGSTRYGWYKSAARVVLLGHGADEQHAGYGRHRTSFRNQVRPTSLEQHDNFKHRFFGCLSRLLSCIAHAPCISDSARFHIITRVIISLRKGCWMIPAACARSKCVWP